MGSIEMKQNYRLNPQLGLKVLPFLYPDNSYHQFNQWNLNTFQGEKSPLIWHDVANNAQLLPILQDNLSNFNHNYQILTFSENTLHILQQQLTNLGIDTSIKLTQECHGEEWENILIICDKTDSYEINHQDLHLVLTRAKNQIIILGDKTYYKNSVFANLFDNNVFYVIGDLTLI
ncbi:hypothetical protein [Geminocystis sp. GBBB08]|uniref:hypothetical protein n=1 Tax=Geminocystis sp. GBBB08 TaxID=2604140 RepID=UPI0027E2468D|nr:hypothetical protein [Geminocystis sp. GBBB08]MBL1209647.1 hypothetical protein [Geminocystis sp. GBBB08]